MNIRILRTIFLTSVFGYMGFAYLDTQEPGLISDVMSVHLWLLPIVVSGVWWAIVEEKVKSEKEKASSHISSSLHLFISLTIGLVFGGLVWHNGDMFGDFRLLLALGAAALPAVGLSTLRL